MVSHHPGPHPATLMLNLLGGPESTPFARPTSTFFPFSTPSPFRTSTTSYDFPHETSSSQNGGAKKKKKNAGAIAGGVVGGLAGLGLKIAGLFIRRRRVAVPPQPDDTPEGKPVILADSHSDSSTPLPQKAYVSPATSPGRLSYILMIWTRIRRIQARILQPSLCCIPHQSRHRFLISHRTLPYRLL
jgi:hypothetical protein